MKLYLCDTPDCQVVTFAETDGGGSRCPGCGFLGDYLRDAETVSAIRRLSWRLLERRAS